MSDLVDVYPFATQDGQAIPLDIIRPASLFKTSANTTIVLPALYTIAAIHAVTKDALVRFGASLPNPLVDGTQYTNTLYIPANGVVITAIPDPTAYVYPTTGGVVYIQLIEKWAGLSLPKQYQRK